MKTAASWTGLLVVVVIALLACDPVMSVRASVRTTASCASPASSRYESAPSVAGAEVALRCPGYATERVLGKTDATGQFALLEVGMLARACSITIRKEGYAPQTFPVDEICVGGDQPRCFGAVITADLAPLEAAPPPIAPPADSSDASDH